MLKEFKAFALKGNVVDLAIGVIIGAAFGGIVESMVGDLIMPFISGIFGKVDFSNLYFVLSGDVPAGASLDDARRTGSILAYGRFLTLAVNFLIVAGVLFLAVKAINTLRDPANAPHEPPAPPSDEVKLLSEIRDLLRR